MEYYTIAAIMTKRAILDTVSPARRSFPAKLSKVQPVPSGAQKRCGGLS